MRACANERREGRDDMKKVTLCGTVLLDEVKKIDRWPDKGMLVTITGASRAVGGAVCRASAAGLSAVRSLLFIPWLPPRREKGRTHQVAPEYKYMLAR